MEFADDGDRHALQVAGEHDQLGARERIEHLGRVQGVREHGGGDSGTARPVERAGLGVARNHAHHGRDGRAAQPVEQRLEVRAAAGNEHGNGKGRGGGRQCWRQRVSAFGFEPLATLSVNGPDCSFSVLVTAM